jgi:hypothetical protein
MTIAPSFTKKQPLNESKYRMPKSRYDSVERYISNHWYNRPEYNDNPPLYNEEVYKRLVDNGKLQKFLVVNKHCVQEPQVSTIFSPNT